MAGRPTRPAVEHSPARAIVAAGETLDLGNERQLSKLRLRRQAWQDEAWVYHDEIGEIKYSVGFKANAISKIRLYPALIVDPDKPPVRLDADELAEDLAAAESSQGDDPNEVLQAGATVELAQAAEDELSRLDIYGPTGGISELLRVSASNLDVPGEFYLIGRNTIQTAAADLSGEVPRPRDDESWDVLSIEEIKVSGKTVSVVTPDDKNGVPLDPLTDEAHRMWRRHPRQRELADSGMRGVLSSCETIITIDRTIRAILKSQASAGVFAVPSELSFGNADTTVDDAEDTEEGDPFDEELKSALTTPITEEGSVSSVVPMVLRGKAEFLDQKYLRHIDVGRKLDAEILNARDKELTRVGQGLNMPLELVVGGMSQANHWTAWQIDDSMFRGHLEPDIVALVDFFTTVFLRPRLEKRGFPPELVERVVVWYDATALITRTNVSQDAKDMHGELVLSDAAWRAVAGFDESDAPDEAEQMRRMISKMRTWPPEVVAAFLEVSFPGFDVPAPAALPGGAPAVDAPPPSPEEIRRAEGPPPEDTRPGVSPDEGPKVPMSAEVVSFVAAGQRARRTNLGRRLATIDRSLRHRLLGAADTAMRRALERAGARAASAKPLARQVRELRKGQTVANEQLCDVLGRSLVAAAGITEEDLLGGSFDDFGSRFDEWVSQSQARALQVVIDAGDLSDDEIAAIQAEQVRSRESAWEWLSAALAALAAQRLYHPAPEVPSLGEFTPGLMVPPSMIREALARAGGATDLHRNSVGGLVIDGGARPAGGVGIGESIRHALLQAGFREEGWTWSHDDPQRPFPPHEALDGIDFDSFEDPVLAVTDEGGWLGVEFFSPGDHDGCMCDAIPRLVITVESDASAPEEENVPA